MSASAATSPAARTLRRCKLEQEVAVAAHGDGSVGLLLHPDAAAGAHRLEVVLAVVRVADRAGEQFRTTRRDDDPATRLLDHLRGLAFAIRGDDHGSRHREDPVEP